MLIPNLFLLSLAGLAIAVPFDPALGEGKASLRSNTETSKSHLTPGWASQTPGELFEAKMPARWLRQRGADASTNDTDSRNATGVDDLVSDPDVIPDKYTVILKHTTKLSPWEHAEWASNLQKNSTTNPKGLEGVPRGKSDMGSQPFWCSLSGSGIYWAEMGHATVKRLRDDPSVSSVNAVGYNGKNMTLMEAFSPYHQYMVIMDPRSKMDVWTHAKTVTQGWINKNVIEDLRLFEGATSFYDDGIKMYSGYFDPETAKLIANDENVDVFSVSHYWKLNDVE